MANYLGSLTSGTRPRKGQTVRGHAGPHEAGTDKAKRCFATSVRNPMEMAEDGRNKRERYHWSRLRLADITQERKGPGHRRSR